MIVVPREFAETRVRRSGAAGARWVAELPRLVDELCRRWDVTLTDEEPRYGELGLVLPAGDRVLKVSWIDETTVDEAIALRAWDGHGAVRLFEADPAVGALLLERLDHRRTLRSLPLYDAARIAGGLARRLAIPAPAGVRSPEVPELARRQRQLGDPLPHRWVDQAVRMLEALTPQPTLVHADLHYGNVLAGRREQWLATDPKPTAAAPERSIPELMWTRLDEADDVPALFDVLVKAGDFDPDLATAWTVVRAVDYWLWGLANGLTEDPVRCHRLLEAVAD